jgi:transcriptional regulator with GAF, ATPase, and Fis domain
VEPTQPHVVEIVAALKEITARVTAASDLDEAIQEILATAAHVLPDHLHCGVTLIAQGSPATFSGSPGAPKFINENEYADGEVPCLEAIRTRTVVVSGDLEAESRWPAWTKLALSEGVRAVLSYPFDLDEPILGAFSLYATRPTSFADETPVVAMLVAEHAGLLLGVLLRQVNLEEKLALAGEITSTDADIERAIGIVMAQRGCSPEKALDHLHQAATTIGVQLTDVAQRLVLSVAARNPEY